MEFAGKIGMADAEGPGSEAGPREGLMADMHSEKGLEMVSQINMSGEQGWDGCAGMGGGLLAAHWAQAYLRVRVGVAPSFEAGQGQGQGQSGAEGARW